jgi:hypothetical protein
MNMKATTILALIGMGIMLVLVSGCVESIPYPTQTVMVKYKYEDPITTLGFVYEQGYFIMNDHGQALQIDVGSERDNRAAYFEIGSGRTYICEIRNSDTSNQPAYRIIKIIGQVQP